MTPPQKEKIYKSITNALSAMPQNTVIIVATDTEKHIIDEALAKYPLPYNIRVIQTGAGISNTLDTLLPLKLRTPIFNFGYVGSNQLNKFSILTVNEVRHYHPNVSFDRPEPKLLLTPIEGLTNAVCYTCQDFVHDTTIVEPAIFDMELAIIARLYQGQPVTSMKIVSDNMDLDEYEQTISS